MTRTTFTVGGDLNVQNFATGDMVRDVYMDRPGGTVTVVDRDGNVIEVGNRDGRAPGSLAEGQGLGSYVTASLDEGQSRVDRESPAGAAPARFWQADARALAADQRDFEALPEDSLVRRWTWMMMRWVK